MASDGYRRGYVSFAHFLLYLFIVFIYLGDNCIQNFHFGRYIISVGYLFGNFVLWLHVSVSVNMIYDHRYDDIPSQMKILNLPI